jgi:hypothetical protein
MKRKARFTPYALAISTALLVASSGSALAYQSNLHVFSVDDVMGGFDGSTFGTGGATQDTDIICDLGTTACPADNGPFLDKSGVMLYPVDSEFGYYIVDFLGAQQKTRDQDFMEGFVGNIVDNGNQMGIQVSNAATEKYKVKPPLGTWCQGLGGTSVKCETEHYSVMEHVLSCYETIPYFYVPNPLVGPPATQAVLSTPDNSLTFDCADAPLDDNALILENGILTTRLVDSTPCEDVNDPVGCQMFPNDKTDMLNNIALTEDYSVQLKDDGKALYGWGGMHKRPNDVRMYAKLTLPAEWKEPGADFVVTKARLVVNHWITNNPNDQLRPEDLENEAATGRKPSYNIDGTPGGPDEIWKSTIPCYEGDGDLIDTEEGANDPTFLGIGTVLKNTPYALDPGATPGTAPSDPPYAFSSDLTGGFTNAFYTTINRDPFEWSYLPDDGDDTTFSFIGCAGPIDDPAYVDTCQDDLDNPYPNVGNLSLVSGPRWRLKPNKFGQDLPGLEIPVGECSPPPFSNDNIKYVVGTPTTTVINLLDWDDSEGPSPLATSKGWVDVDENEFVEVAGTDPNSGIPFTTNGLPMTSDFDLAVYVKGDRKSTAVYNAQLFLEYEGGEPPGDDTACGMPTSYDPAVERGVFVWKNCDTGEWFARFTSAGDWIRYQGTVDSDTNFTNVTPQNVESSDVLDYTTDPSLITFKLGMSGPWFDGFDFSYPDGSTVCFGVHSPPGIIAVVGSENTPVAVPFDLETLGPCL